jgi:DNA-binding transcriptional LysR family regulator
MRDINLNRLAVFVALVRAGSFTAAAEQLGMTKAMVSQHLARLEKEVGMTLLLRTTRRMSLTTAGQRFHDDCVRIVAEAEAAITRLGECRDTPAGPLRIAAAGDHGPAIVAPLVAEYAALHPGITPELVVGDAIVDLVAERFDVAIRVGWLRDSDLRSTRLGDVRQRLVASPGYLRRHGVPDAPAALASHAWVALSVLPSPLRWSFTSEAGEATTVTARAAASVNSTLAARALVLAGMGLSVLPHYLVDIDISDGRLVHVLPEHALPVGGVHAVYAGHPPPVKVRAFIDLLKQRLTSPGFPAAG